MKACDLTYKILTYSVYDEVNSDHAVDWAGEMIELGFESPNLFMLASFTKPTNYFEIQTYLKEAVKELGFEMKEGKEAILSYATYYVLQITKRINIRNHLTELYYFCQKMDYDEAIYDFYLLHWAWDDLDYEDSEYNHYWYGARRSNISDIVVEEAEKWLAKNRLPLS